MKTLLINRNSRLPSFVRITAVILILFFCMPESFSQQNATLPLHRLDLKVYLKGNRVELVWIAENEMNTSLFTVQKSTDGINFISLGSNPAAGLTNIATEYRNFDDLNSNVVQGAAVIYYRIKAEDNTGKFNYSNIVPVKPEKITGIKIWPNPFVEDVRITYTAISNATVFVNMTDLAGKTLKQWTFLMSRGVNQVSLSGIEMIPAGVYILQVTDEAKKILCSEKVLKGS